MNIEVSLPRLTLLMLFVSLAVTACSLDSSETTSGYARQLQLAEKMYPFEEWKSYSPEMEQYTVENCDAAAEIFDNLLAGLAEVGVNASSDAKLAHFRKAILALNELNEGAYLIETWEREQLAALVDEITRLAGLDPVDYAGGAGISDLWRTW